MSMRLPSSNETAPKPEARVSGRTAFLLLGELVEDGPTAEVFTAPKNARTGDYIEGRFG